MSTGKIYEKIAAIFILAVIFTLGFHKLKEAPYSIYMVYDQVEYEGEEELYAQLFYSTYTHNNPWREKMSFMAPIKGNKARFVIPVQRFEDIHSFRFDPVQEQAELRLAKIVFYKSFLPVKTVWPEEFLMMMNKSAGAELELEEGKLKIVSTNDDSQLYLENGFYIEWEERVLAGWGLVLAVISGPVLYLLKRLSVLLWERGGRRTVKKVKQKMKQQLEKRQGPLAEKLQQLKKGGQGVWQWIKRRIILLQGYFRYYPRRCLALVLVSLTGVIVFLFWGYLTGEKFWIFTGIASDSYGQVFPNYHYAAKRIEEGYNTAGWNFLAGLGNNIGAYDFDINNWIMFFGTQRLPYLFVFSYLFKLILSGVVFYFYLRVMGRRKLTGLVFGLGYAFCGHMVIRGRWENMPREVLLVAILLLCFELYFMKKDKRWLPLAILLFVANSSSYAALLYGVVFCGYAMFRYFTQRTFQGKDFLRFVGGLLLCLLLASPMLLGSVEWILSSLGSSRFQTGVSGYTASLAGQERDWFLGLQTIQSAFFRTIGMDIVGMENAQFSGEINGLEDPTFYCGLVAILMLPAAFCKEDKKKKYWYIGGLVITGMYFFINPLRLLVGGMSGDSTFKLSSFWIIVLFLYLGAEGFERFLEQPKLARRILLAGIFLMAISVAFILAVNQHILWKYLIASLMFILLYMLVFILYSKKRYQNYRFILSMLLAGLCMLEPIVLSYDHINPSTAVKNNGERRQLNDYSIEVLETVRGMEESNAYRIDKQYESYGRCDSLYQNYMGTRSYVGGLGIRSEVVELYESLSLPKLAVSSLLGTSVSDEINTLSGVKYVLTNTGMLPNYGYTYRQTTEGIDIYENEYALPLVYGYTAYMYRTDFDKLSVQEKKDAMLQYCILEEGEASEELVDYPKGSIDRDKMLEDYGVIWERTEDTIRFEQNTKGNVVVLKLKTEDVSTGKSKNYIHFREGLEKSDKVEISIPAVGEEVLLTFNQEGINELVFDLGEKVDLQVVNLAIIPQQVYYAHYRECIEELKAIQAQKVIIDEAASRMTGRISVKTPTQLCFSIPYDQNWKLYLNGKETPLQKENICFIGAFCEEGEYEFELRYEVEENLMESFAGVISGGLCVIHVVVCTWIDYQQKKKAELKKA